MDYAQKALKVVRAALETFDPDAARARRIEKAGNPNHDERGKFAASSGTPLARKHPAFSALYSDLEAGDRRSLDKHHASLTANPPKDSVGKEFASYVAAQRHKETAHDHLGPAEDHRQAGHMRATSMHTTAHKDHMQANRFHNKAAEAVGQKDYPDWAKHAAAASAQAHKSSKAASSEPAGKSFTPQARW